jgi:hypothetical protein
MNKLFKKLRKLFFGETYQEILDRKYGGSIPANILVSDRELSKAGEKRTYKITITNTPTNNGNSYYNAFFPHSLNKHHFRKRKISKLFSL